MILCSRPRNYVLYVILPNKYSTIVQQVLRILESESLLEACSRNRSKKPGIRMTRYADHGSGRARPFVITLLASAALL